MNRRLAMGLSYLAGAVMTALFIALLNPRDPEPAPPVPAPPAAALQAMPRTREHAAVLCWMFEHRADAADLEFLNWTAPTPVPRNPFTNAPATLVKVVVKNRKGTEADREYLTFYLQDRDVLGSVSRTDPEPGVLFTA